MEAVHRLGFNMNWGTTMPKVPDAFLGHLVIETDGPEPLWDEHWTDVEHSNTEMLTTALEYIRTHPEIDIIYLGIRAHVRDSYWKEVNREDKERTG